MSILTIIILLDLTTIGLDSIASTEVHTSIAPTDENIVLSPTTGPVSISEDGPQILLRNRAFDPLAQMPLPLSNTQLGLFYSEPTEYRLIQFSGPIMPEWKDGAEDNGIQLISYIPDYAYIARVPEDYDNDISLIPGARWTGPYHPYYKLEPSLLNAFGNIPPDALDDIDIEANYTISLLESSDEVVADVRTELVELDAGLLTIDFDAALKAGVAEIALTPAQLLEAARIPEVGWLQPAHQFVPHNYQDSRIVNARQAQDGPFKDDGTAMWSYDPATDKFYGHTGSTATVAIVDTGVDGTHPAFDGRKATFFAYNWAGQWQDVQYHGTHVAGTALGNGRWRINDPSPGTTGRYAGIAPNASLIGQAYLGSGYSVARVMSDAAIAGADASSNSWGFGSSFYFGVYESVGAAYDGFVRDSAGDNRPVSILFSAGNDGPGEGTVSPPATAKNIICVGSTDDNNGNSISGFSARGPMEDGRIKPDILTPGAQVTSALANSANSYAAFSGTSMACPGAAGGAALVYDYYRQVHGHNPSPALVKAVLLNGATPMPGYTWPDSNQGWGRMDMPSSLLETQHRKFLFYDQTDPLDTNEEVSYVFNVAEQTRLKIMMVWTDVPGNPQASKALVNDLDLIVESPEGDRYVGNQFYLGQSIPGGSQDNTNNVEAFVLNNPSVGEWKIMIKGSNVPSGPQDFAVVVSGPVWEDMLDISTHALFSLKGDEVFSGEQVPVNGSIRNTGTLAFGGGQYVLTDHLPDGSTNRLLVSKVQETAAGEFYNFTFDWVPDVIGTHTLVLSLDPLDIFEEANETNNILEININVNEFGVRLVNPEPELAVVPGKAGAMAVQVFNTGTVEDTYQLAISGVPSGWNAYFNRSNVTVPVNSYRNVTLNLETPDIERAGFTDGIIITSTSTLSPAFSSQQTFSVRIAKVHGFELENAYIDWTIDAGGTASYEIKIRNRGNSDLILAVSPDLTARSAGAGQARGLSSGWTVELSTDRLLVPYNGTARLQALLTAPVLSLAGHLESVPIKLEVSENDNGAGPFAMYDHCIINATVTQYYDFELEMRSTNMEIAAGKTKRLDLRVVNNGNGLDTFDFEAYIPDGWGYTFSPETVSVDAFEKADIRLTIKVPSTELAGVYELAVKSTSTNQPGSECGLWFKLSLRQDYIINLIIENQVVIVPVGSTLVVPLYIQNRGNGLDTVSLDNNWFEGFILYTEEVVNVEPQEKKLVNTVIHIPDYFSPSNHTVELIALAGDGETLIRQELTVIITPSLKPAEQPDGNGGLNESDVTVKEGDETFGLFENGYYFDIFIFILILLVIVMIIFMALITIDRNVDAAAARKLAAAERARATPGRAPGLIMRDVKLVRKKREITTVRIKKQKRRRDLAEGELVEGEIQDAEVAGEIAVEAEVVEGDKGPRPRSPGPDGSVDAAEPEEPVEAEVVDTPGGPTNGLNWNNNDPQPPRRPFMTIFIIGLILLTSFAGMTVLDVAVETASAGNFQGNIYNDTVWSENMTLTGHTTVRPGATLYIMPGVHVWIDNGVWFNIAGTLYANGTANNTITFTSIRDKPGVSGNPWNGIWNRIQFNGSAAGRMNYCEVRRAVYGVIFDGDGGDPSDNIRIENCTFTRNRNGIYLYDFGNNNYFINNTIHDNGWGYGIYVRNSKFNYFEKNNLTDNTYNFYITGWNKDSFMQYFENYTNTNQGEPMYYWLDRQDELFPENGSFYAAVGCTNVTVRNVTAVKGGEGIVFAYTDSSTIENVTVRNCNYGIYLYLSGDNNVIRRSTVTSNSWGLYLHHSTKSIVRDNNLGGNTYNIYILGSTPQRFDHDIDTSNKVQNSKRIYYYVNRADETVPASAGFVGIASCTNITVEGVDSRRNGQGILVAYSEQVYIEDVYLYKNYYGTYFYRNTGRVKVGNSTSVENSRGAYFYESDDDLYWNTVFEKNYDGLEISRSRNLKLDNCSIISANRWNLNIYGSGSYGSTVTLLNTSFNPNKIRTETSGTELTVKWFLNIKALDDLGRSAACRVNVSDGLGNVVVDKNIIGELNYIECIGYQQYPGLIKFQFNNYTVEARNATLGIVRDINMTYSRSVRFTFNSKPTGLLPEFLEFNEDEELVLELSDYFHDANILIYSTYVFPKLDIELDNVLKTATITAPPNWCGSELITIRVIDTHGEFIESTSRVTVIPANDPPVFKKSVPNIHLPEGVTTYKFDLSDYVDDPDHTYCIDVINWYIADEDTGVVKFIGENSSSLDLELQLQDPDYTGSQKLTLCIEDSMGASSAQELWLNITPRNDIPILSDGLVSPVQGSTDTDFTFSVVYWDIEGDLPRNVQLVLDDVYYSMTEQNLSDRNTQDGKLYYYTCKLGRAGEHRFSFAAADIFDGVGFSAGYSGPFVTVVTPTTGAISGRVVDSNLSLCLAGTAVTLYYDGNGTQVPGGTTVADAHGGYTFTDLMPGFYTIRAELDGYHPASTESILVKPGEVSINGTSFELVKTSGPDILPEPDTDITDLDITISYSGQELYTRTNIFFNGTAVDADGDELIFYWDFDDLGSKPTGAYAVYNYTRAGKYNITMTVLDEDGNTARMVKALVVKEKPAPPPTVIKEEEEDRYGDELWLVSALAIMGVILILIPWFVFYRKRRKRAMAAARKLRMLKQQMDLRTRMATEQGLPGTAAGQVVSITPSPVAEQPQLYETAAQPPAPTWMPRPALPPTEPAEAEVLDAETAEETMETEVAGEPIESEIAVEELEE